MKKRNPTICPVVYSLDIFGDKWSLVILRDILLCGKNHFREFLASEEKIASNILSSRLKTLVNEGLLIKEDDRTNKSATIYKPTKKALELLPMLFKLMHWGITYNPNVDTTSTVMKELMNNPKKLHQRIVEKFNSA
ncbi:MAG TPA: helix-turn-helix domain-containing protein [Candidatus Sulfotelmatobacter sp.]|jgi:DNA-binding HxlR family transcriptional regulator|nr:helix-turn-helix domain-containing protein [Candidatus Sulfotelmatobacter sp.]